MSSLGLKIFTVAAVFSGTGRWWLFHWQLDRKVISKALSYITWIYIFHHFGEGAREQTKNNESFRLKRNLGSSDNILRLVYTSQLLSLIILRALKLLNLLYSRQLQPVQIQHKFNFLLDGLLWDSNKGRVLHFNASPVLAWPSLERKREWLFYSNNIITYIMMHPLSSAINLLWQ